jgi:hypothetical protein
LPVSNFSAIYLAGSDCNPVSPLLQFSFSCLKSKYYRIPQGAYRDPVQPLPAPGPDIAFSLLNRQTLSDPASIQLRPAQLQLPENKVQALSSALH